MKSLILTTAFFATIHFVHAQTKLTSQPFSKIIIKTDAKIFIKQDATCTISSTGNEKDSESDVYVKNGVLVISGSPAKDMHITLPELQQVSIEGHGAVVGESKFNVESLKLAIDGDGKIDMDVNAKYIDATIAGLGKITLKGTAQEADFSIPGSGKIDAIEMKTIRCKVSISGLGKCMVDVTDELSTNIDGNGTVSYKKMPKKMNENISGMGKVKSLTDDNIGVFTQPDTTRLELGENQLWIIGKKDSTRSKKHRTKPIWQGFEMGLNSYMDNGGTFTLSPGKENFDLRTEKSTYVSLNCVQTAKELGHSNVWIFSGLGITWNNYRFHNDIVLQNGPVTKAVVDTTPNIRFIKSKLVAIYLTAPFMMEVFTSHDKRKAFHIGAGAMLGLRIGSHTKRKIEMDEDNSKLKEFDDFNLVPFRYGFRVAIGYGKFNVFADYYASTLFRENKGPVLYPVNAGITLIGF